MRFEPLMISLPERLRLGKPGPPRGPGGVLKDRGHGQE